MMEDRGLSIAHTTIMRWVYHYAPDFECRWNRFAQATGASWRIDETYVKVRGESVHLYRAVDHAGNTIDFRLSPERDAAAAKAFVRKAIKKIRGLPHGPSRWRVMPRRTAVREMKADGELAGDTKLRSSEHLNNLIEHDDRGVKARIGPMLGFKRVKTAAITITATELLRRIRKG